ncbi:hypothetical protein Taro_033413 [Colocasia esculenta]|uniref:FRIGIDA-like protein n=1 Tax=Colocasia esculenta TaxID=4460 RepID=A0A843VV89_COLES|nr:hypothetical protein [Colocasia esculenta]
MPGSSSMDDTQSVASLIESTTSKIQQLQQAFTELESHRAVTLNLKWKELEEHFHGLERSLKKRFNELVDQEKAYDNKASEAREMLENRKAMVVAKEHSSLEWLQEKRDAALSAIGSALGKSQNSLVIPIASNNEQHVLCVERLNEEGTKIDSEDAYLTQIMSASSQPCSPLMKLCQEMDAKGLNEYISENRKNLASIREEIPTALRSSSSPLNLVLDSLKNFYRLEMPEACGKKDADLLGLRRTCLMLLETLGQLLAELDPVPENLVISSDIKQQAKAIADEWKSRLNDLDIDASGGNSLEVHAFLQLLATFGIVSEFNQDEICNLIPSVSRRRQTADLCRSLGLAHRMTDVIEALSNSGRQIEAINLAYAFELTEQFAPVPLLKAYLKESRRTSQVKAGNTSPSAQVSIQNEMNEREISALKAIIKCIEEHKLEEQYPLDPLQKRVFQLEKAKADKKRAAEVAKPQSKRPRAIAGNGSPNGVGYAPRLSNIPDKSFYRGPERYPYAYERQYVYPVEAHASPLLSTAAYSLPHNHSNYYGNGYQYQSPFIH